MSADISHINSPIVIYVVHHPDCESAHCLSRMLFRWFRLGDLIGDTAAAGLPVYYRRQLHNDQIHPAINWDSADLNVVILLADHLMIGDSEWRKAVFELEEKANRRREQTDQADGESAPQVLLLPVALHESFYRAGPLYQHFNPVRLLDMTEQERQATLRRAATEATARALRARQVPSAHPPLNIFLSHAKRDGTQIAEQLRDGVRRFGQLVAWYDANDLPYGMQWESPMKQAVKQGTAAMVATVTDAYPSGPWCRLEANLARTPESVDNDPWVWGGSRWWRFINPVKDGCAVCPCWRASLASAGMADTLMKTRRKSSIAWC